LVSINAGISYVGDAVKQRIYMEMESGEAPVKLPGSEKE
jgi:hypothetical protein